MGGTSDIDDSPKTEAANRAPLIPAYRLYHGGDYAGILEVADN